MSGGNNHHMFKPTNNFTRGFCAYDFVRGQEQDAWRGGTLDMIEDELARCTRPTPDDPDCAAQRRRIAQYLLNQRGRQSEEDYQVARVSLSAMQWLRDNAANAPFFLWFDSFDPHEPWDPPQEYADAYYAYDGPDIIYPGREPHLTEPEKARIRALYCGEVTFVDKWIGALLNEVDALGLWDDTVVMVTCDHGTQLYDQARFGKGSDEMHPFNTQILWYVRHPDGPCDQQVNPFVQSHDLMPTALRLLDVPYANVDGQDAWQLVTGEKALLRDHIVGSWASFVFGPAGGRVSVRDEDWNYVTSAHEVDPCPELYDLHADPQEVHNVHDKHPDIVTKQKRRAEAVIGQAIPAQFNEVCDPAPSPRQRFIDSRGLDMAAPKERLDE